PVPMTAVADRPLGPELARAESLSPDTDVLVIGLTSSENGPSIVPDDLLGHVPTEQVRADLLDALGAVGAKGKAEELTRVPAPAGLDEVASVLAVGLGAAEKVDAEQIRRSAGVAARSLSGAELVATTLGGLDLA